MGRFISEFLLVLLLIVFDAVIFTFLIKLGLGVFGIVLPFIKIFWASVAGLLIIAWLKRFIIFV